MIIHQGRGQRLASPYPTLSFPDRRSLPWLITHQGRGQRLASLYPILSFPDRRSLPYLMITHQGRGQRLASPYPTVLLLQLSIAPLPLSLDFRLSTRLISTGPHRDDAR